MPNDAKLGLVIGVGLVIVVAVVFFGKELVPEHPQSPVSASAMAVSSTRPAEDPSADERPKAQTTSYSRPILGDTIAPVSVTVEVVKKQ